MTPPRDAAGRAAPSHPAAACRASRRPRESTVFPEAGVHTTDFHFSHQYGHHTFLKNAVRLAQKKASAECARGQEEMTDRVSSSIDILVSSSHRTFLKNCPKGLGWPAGSTGHSTQRGSKACVLALPWLVRDPSPRHWESCWGSAPGPCTAWLHPPCPSGSTHGARSRSTGKSPGYAGPQTLPRIFPLYHRPRCAAESRGASVMRLRTDAPSVGTVGSTQSRLSGRHHLHNAH